MHYCVWIYEERTRKFAVYALVTEFVFFLLQNIEIVMFDCVFRLCFCAEMALLSKCLS